MLHSLPVKRQEIAATNTYRVSNHADVTTTRIRWTTDRSALLYSADGRLWKLAASGGPPVEIRFTASLSITRPKRSLPSAHFPEAGQQQALLGACPWLSYFRAFGAPTAELRLFV